MGSGSLEGKRVLITGGGGNLGSHICERLMGENAKLSVMERRSHSENKLVNLKKCKDVSIFWGDIRNTRDCHQALKEQDIVIHAAAMGHVPYSVQYPREVWETNVDGTLNILEAARAGGVEKLVYINSSEAYGTAKSIPITEEHGFYPRSPYGASKGAGELLAHSYHVSYGIKFTAVRLFNLFGPRPLMYAVIPKFILLALENRPLPVSGSGKQKRDYIYVEDAADAVALVAGSDKLNGEAVNIASGEPRKIIDIAKMIIEITGSKSRIEHGPARPGEVPVLHADVSKAKRALGWEPRHSFEDGIRKTVEWCVENREFLQPMQVSKSL
ncbi:MAG: SDR family NAD(P)-dependent oxidoreductase [Candidatus Micrarchaeota archaeon]